MFFWFCEGALGKRERARGKKKDDLDLTTQNSVFFFLFPPPKKYKKSFSCVTELPVFYFAGKLVSRVGARRVLDGSAAAYVFRLLGYTFLGPTAGDFLLLEILFFFCFVV